MESKEIPASDERAVETGQHTEAAPLANKAETTGYYEPHQLTNIGKDGRLYVIADTVGGAASGQVASQYAVKKMLYTYYNDDNPNLEVRLLEAVRQTNLDIFQRNQEHPNRRAMATTLMAAVVHDNKLLVANVGDNAVYVVWDQDIEQLNGPQSDEKKPEPDQSPKALPAETAPPAPAGTPAPIGTPASAGTPTPIETTDVAPKPAEKAEDDKSVTIEVKPEGNQDIVIGIEPKRVETRPNPVVAREQKPTKTAPKTLNLPTALGLEETVKIETYSRRLFAGDIVVLISGGLTGYVTNQEIARAMTKHAPDQAMRRLISLAADRGNRNHISISTTRVLSSPVAMRTPLPMVVPGMPRWSDWERPPRPGKPITSSDDKPSTRPMSKPVPPSPPPTPLSKPPSTEIPLNPPRWRWQGCLIIPVLLLVLCGLTLTAAQFLIPQETRESIPLFQDLQALIEEQGFDAVGTGDVGAEDVAGNPEETSENELATETNATPVAQESSADTTSPLSTPTPFAPTPTVVAAATEVAPVASPTEASQATPVPTEPTPETVATESPAAEAPTATPLAAIEAIALPEGCESKARFVTDVTVDDGTQFAPGEAFNKVWRIRNEGTCPWGGGFTIRYVNDEFFGTQQEVPIVEVTNPNETFDVSVPMVAPDENGTYRSVWQMYDIDGVAFGPTMFLEIEVTPSGGGAGNINVADSGTLFDFVQQASSATWSAGGSSYTVQGVGISEELPQEGASGGLVAVGGATLRGNTESEGDVLLTHPNQELGLIEGNYQVDVPLQPGDALAATLSFPKLSILSDDGVIYEVSFTPDDGSGQVITVLSRAVQYTESPITDVFPLPDIQAGQTGTFTLRVLSGNSTNSDWALWVDLRLIRP